MIVLDASILIKLFKIEADSPIARRLVDDLIDANRMALAPTIVVYEALAAALHVAYPFATIHELFERLGDTCLSIENPSRDELSVAEGIAATEAPGGGYPSLFDSIYHAMAVVRGGTFVTADAKHITKAGQFGHIQLLKDWTPG